MNPPERSGPCPCGSGKKYRNCCEKRETAALRRSEAHRRALPRAIEWLVSRHRAEIERAIERDFIGHLPAGLRRDVDRIPEELRREFHWNGVEWLVAEGSIDVTRGSSKRRTRVSELVLGPGGPMLFAEERAFLEAMATTPIRLFEVIESRADDGLRLSDLSSPGSAHIWVNERAGSRHLVQGDVLGARVVPVQDHLELSGAVYTFGHRDGLELPDEIQGVLAPGGPVAVRGAEGEHAISSFVIRRWLTSRTRPPEMPMTVDASSREPLMLVTDHYEVLDWDALERALGKEPDVEGDSTHGWTRFEPGADPEGPRRSLLAINRGEGKDRLEPFARTQRLADEGRTWLQQVAGDSIRFLLRDSVDPMELLKGKGASPRRRRSIDSAGASILAGSPGALALPPEGLTPEQLTAISQQFHERQYAKWADEPIPFLGGRSPREALGTPAGRQKILRLLRRYEGGELRRAREENRAPADLGFLYAQVGLKPESAK